MEGLPFGPDGRPLAWPLPRSVTWRSDRFQRGLLVGALQEAESHFCCGKGEGERYRIQTGPDAVRIDVDGPDGLRFAKRVLSQWYPPAAASEADQDGRLRGVEADDSPCFPLRAVVLECPEETVSADWAPILEMAASLRFNHVYLLRTGSRCTLDSSRFHDMESDFEFEIVDGTALTRLESDGVVLLRSSEPWTEASRMVGTVRGGAVVLEDPDLKKALVRLIQAADLLWCGPVIPVPEMIRRTADEIHGVILSALDQGSSSGRSPECGTWPEGDIRTTPIDLSAWVDSPLYRLSWRNDDYDFGYLTSAKPLRKTPRFFLFPGAIDPRLDSSIIVVESGRTTSMEIRPFEESGWHAVHILHSIVAPIKTNRMAGRYRIALSDGTSLEQDLACGQEIGSWKAEAAGGGQPLKARTIYSGITRYGARYRITAIRLNLPGGGARPVRLEVEVFAECPGIAIFAVTLEGPPTTELM